MALNLSEKDLEKIIMVGDKVLVKPKNPNQKTSSGLYLPPAALEKEHVQSGYVIKTGPGFPIPAMQEEDEPWKESADEVKYMPLQAKEGDLAVYLNKSGIEVEFKKEKYQIISHSSILMLVREEGLFQ
ncbi:MAG: co-chaperone GroES family protein [Marinilabiliales bacterium]|nr:co-chaperone GroES family protein [Marinilabiliales bacterium]